MRAVGLRGALLAAGAVVVGTLLLAGSARADFRVFASPGPLARGHASIENNCDACHVPYKGIPSSACLGCHVKLRDRIDRGQGPHALYEKELRACSSCHRDHKGRDKAITPAVEPGFDHAASTGFALEGGHKKAQCQSCHTPRASTGHAQWIELPRACADCHKKAGEAAHHGTLGANACQSCHSATDWKAVKKLSEHKVPMSGHHQNLTCEGCHKLGAHLEFAKTSSCGDCHDQKHGGTKAPCATCHTPTDWKSATFAHDFCTCILPGKHQSAPCLGCHPAFKFTPTPMVCAGCHLKDRPHDDLGGCARCHSALSFKAKAFDHDRPAVHFAITGRHQEVGCENCHTKKNVYKGAPTACQGCHKTPDHGDFGPCAKCHTTADFKVPTFSHKTTRFALDGHHAQVKCQDCHAAGKFKIADFKPGTNSCVLCHGLPHGAQFGTLGQSGVKPAQPGRRIPGRFLLADASATPSFAHVSSRSLGCLDCHTTSTWKPSTFDAAVHGALGFALNGAHAQLECVRCHDKGVFVGTPIDCAGCHNDRHRARFGADCARCHDETKFKHVPSFNHGTETGVPLENAHTKVSCAGCHGDDGTRLVGKTNIGCATCHATVPGHGDQFGPKCETCHKTTRFSDVPPFNHATTFFPLERRHAPLPCLACHDASRRARVTPDCKSCHGDPHKGRAGLDCQDCHRADDWNLLRYDHDRTEFPLSGMHFVVACYDCHTTGVYSGIRHECVSCHRGDKLRGNAKVMGHMAFGWDCAGCHKPFKW